MIPTKMDQQTYLLVCLMEELAEATVEVSKCLRFGLTNQYEHYTVTNIDKLIGELSDVTAIKIMLETAGLPLKIDFIRVKEKHIRTREFMAISRERGILEDDSGLSNN